MRFLRHPAQRVVASSLLTQSAVVVTGPLAVRLLGLESRGEVAIVFAAVLLVSQVGPWGLPQAFGYYVATGSTSAAAVLRGHLPRYLLRATAVALVGAGAMTGVALTTGLLSSPGAEIVIMAAACIVTMVAVLVIALLQGAGRFTSLAIVQAVPAFSYLAALVTLLVVGHASVVAVLVAYFAGWFVLDVVGLALLWRIGPRVAATPSREQVRAYGRRSWLSSSAPIDNLGIDQLAVGLTLGSHALGLFVVGLAFRVPIVLVLVAIAGVCGPTVAGIEDAESRRAYCRRWLSLTLGIAVGVVLLVQAVLGLVLVPAFGEEAAAAEAVSRLLVGAAAFLGWRRVIASLLHGLNRPGDATFAEVCGLVTMLVLMGILGALFGVEGAAGAMAAGGAVTCGVGLVRLRRALSGSAAARA